MLRHVCVRFRSVHLACAGCTGSRESAPKLESQRESRCMAYVNVYGTLEEVESQLTYRLQVFNRGTEAQKSFGSAIRTSPMNLFFVARWAPLARPASGLQRSSPLRTYLPILRVYARLLRSH